MKKPIATLVAVLAAAVLLAGLVGPASANAGRPPLLGAKAFAPNGLGFGVAHPKRIFNGGDPNGFVRHVRWRHWGRAVAIGHGLGSQFKPGGGYYARPVKVRLRAKRLGYCGNSNWPAYTRLVASMQVKPGGRFSDWFRWSGASTICVW